MVKKKNFLQRLAESFSPTPAPINPNDPQRVIVQLSPFGSSGTEIYGGYFNEEYLGEHKGDRAADTYDKMRRGEAVLAMCLAAVKNPIRKANWEVQAADDSDMARIQKEFIESQLFSGLQSWDEFLCEALSCVDFGHSVFEVVHKIVINDKKFGNYTGLKKLGFRSQRTLWRWHLSDETGAIEYLEQNASGDLSRYVKIPGDFLVVFSLNKEGDNYEGISALRPCLGAWRRKQVFLKLMAIGIEKNAVPTPIAKVPIGKDNSPEYSALIEVLKAYTSHQQAYIVYPDGWDINFNGNNYDPDKTKQAIEFENKEMVYAFLANFLLLGTSGAGSYALSFDLSDFFLSGIEHIAYMIADKLNRQIIKQLIDLNWGPQENYPQLRVSGISDKAGKEFAEILNSLAQSKYITPDDRLEAHIRERLGLPEVSTEGQRQVQPPQPPPGAKFTEVKLADKPKTAHSLIGQKSAELKDFMQEQLRGIAGQLVDDLVSTASRLPESQKLNAVKQVSPSGSRVYKELLLQKLAETAFQAEQQARKEIPGGSKIKLSEDGIQLSEFDKLPPRVQKRLKAQADLLVETQMADLEKATYFQFSSSVGASYGSDEILAADLKEAADRIVIGPSTTAAAGNSAAMAVNEARNAFFFSEETLQEIESFTFTNPDPVSPICQDLTGTTFAKDDPTADRYSPPLHHNAVCQGTMVATDKGNKAIEEINVGDLVLTHTGRFCRVYETMNRFEDKDYFELTLDNGLMIRITAEHPVLTQRGWLRVDQLLITDDVICQKDVENQPLFR